MFVKTKYGKINKKFCGREIIKIQTVGDLRKVLKKLPDNLPIGMDFENYKLSVYNVSLDNPHLRIEEDY